MSAGAERLQRIAVLGAGNMGLQLAAQLANVRTEVVLFDLALAGPDPYAGLQRKLSALQQQEPPAFALPSHCRGISLATYQHDLAKLHDCQLVIETTTELCDCKEGVLARIAPYLHKQAIITTTTDTLGIERLARALPESLRARFCGLHFLLPPRYTRLVELAPSSHTDPRVLEQLSCFVAKVLGKQAVRVKDSPLYIADRMAVFLFNLVWRTALRFELRLETVDALLERTFQLSQGGLFGALDRYGVKRFAHLFDAARKALPDDPWLSQLEWPEVLQDKSDAAMLYSSQAGQPLSLDITSGAYRPVLEQPLGELDKINAQDWPKLLRDSDTPGARTPEVQFLRAFLSELCLYSARYLDQMTHSCAEFDLAVRFAFNADIGIFERWQSLGWQCVQGWLPDPARALAAWPDWVTRSGAAYCRKGAYDPATGSFQPFEHKSAPQCLPKLEITNTQTSSRAPKELMDCGISIHSSDGQTTILTVQDCTVLQQAEALQHLQAQLAVELQQSDSLVLALRGFSSHQTALVDDLPELLAVLESLYLQLRYAPVPIVACLSGALNGPALALALACSHRVCAQNTCLFAGLRTAEHFLPTVSGVGHALIEHLAEAPTLLARQVKAACYIGVLLGKPFSVGTEYARQQGLLSASDTIQLNPVELIETASQQAQQLRALGYRAPPAWPIAVLGYDSLETVSSLVADQFAERPFSAIATRWKMPLIRLLCGGDAATDALLDDQRLLSLEQETYQTLWRRSSP